MKNSSKSQTSSLDEVRAALKEADSLRFSEGLDKESLLLLEETAHELRKAERLLIDRIQNKLLSQSKVAAAELSANAAQIRKKIKKMNQTVKLLDYFETFIKSSTKILAAIGKLI